MCGMGVPYEATIEELTEVSETVVAGPKCSGAQGVLLEANMSEWQLT